MNQEQRITHSSSSTRPELLRPVPDMASSDDPLTFARPYQLEAMEKAIMENTIAYLETGSGKTLIALMLIRSHAHLIRKPSQFIAVFLVPTVVLVTQQAAVVETHTDLKVGKYWGEQGIDYWDAITWKSELDIYEVLVMTPQILLDALRHGFLKLQIIKLLIFDECHNARGNSPYACIMKEFYHPQLQNSNPTRLPRIFGMTASLIKTKGSSSPNVYKNQILELESLMNSKVYTVDNEEVLARYIPFSTLRLKLYEDIEGPHCLSSCLAEQLKCLENKYMDKLALEGTPMNPALKKISRLCAAFMLCLEDLGIWLAYKAAESLSHPDTNIYFWGPERDQFGERIARAFSEDVYQAFSACIPCGPRWHIGDNISANMDAGLLTAKVICLIESLMEYRTITDLRCIVFVERVITAIVLQCLLSQVLVSTGWHTTYMAGSHFGFQSQTRKEQSNIIEAFRRGAVNIIVATQILEEGLDVQNCNLVIRFDPSATISSFIQSRGRARMEGSDYVLIVKSGDSSTLSRVENFLASGAIMREECLRNTCNPCAPLESEVGDEEIYHVESTGAVVTLNSSVQLIYNYCSKLPSDKYYRPTPRFLLDKISGFCTLMLPSSCPIQSVCVQGKRDMLKKNVCLKACRKLHEIGALTDNLLPDVASAPTEPEDIGGAQSYGDEQLQYFPRELVNCWPSSSDLYHCYTIGLKGNFNCDAPFRDIILAVQCVLEYNSTDMSFELECYRGTVTVSMVYAGAINFTHEQVLMARRFQITVLTALIDQSLDKLKDAIDGIQQKDALARVDYLLLPSVDHSQDSSLIDWDCVKSSFSPQPGEVICNHHCHTCSARNYNSYMQTKDGLVCRCVLVNSLVFTPHNGQIYVINEILDELNENAHMKGGQTCTYKEYYQSRHGIKLQKEESLLGGRHLFKVHNCLQKQKYYNGKERSNACVELPAELCRIILSPISISTLFSFSLVPSIMFRVESILLALNLKKILALNYSIPTIKVLEAITRKKCQEKFSLESLETLGDSFLKYAVSQQLFRENECYHEGLLSAKKDTMVSNSALCKLACDQKLQGFIRQECFDPKKWVIPGDSIGCSVLGEISLSTSGTIYVMGERCIKRKVVADVVEALIGACLITAGELAALNLMESLGIKVEFCTEVPNEGRFLLQPEKHLNVRHLESLLKYTFHEPDLLVEALTHGSYHVPEIPRCYQRLEFLGDSVLDYLITIHMYNKYPGISPGLLTDLRSSSVNNDRYACAAVKASLHKHILHASSELHRDIVSFINNFDQFTSGSSFGCESETAAPKVLGDVIESLAGAILVDSGYNKDTVWECMRPILEPLVTLDTLKLHPVRELNELCDLRSYKKKILKSFENGVAFFTVEVKADGTTYVHTSNARNKKLAKKQASKVVLESLKERIAADVCK